MGTCDIVEPYNIEYRLVRSDGEIRDINSRGAKTANRLGEPNFMHGTAQDITERHQAEQRFRRAMH
jgi:PAS domain S-box-containing protein